MIRQVYMFANVCVLTSHPLRAVECADPEQQSCYQHVHMQGAREHAEMHDKQESMARTLMLP